jgi:hypothetical protein
MDASLTSWLIELGISFASGGIIVWVLLSRLDAIRRHRENDEWVAQIQSTPVDPRERRA